MPVYAAPIHRYAAPLRRWLRLRGYTVAAVRPPEAAAMTASGRVDAGMAPLLQFLEDPRLQVLEDAPMVYSRGETMSSIVVSRAQTSLRGCSSIAVTPETRTSIAYLALALSEQGLSPRLVPGRGYSAEALLSTAPCALVLGDAALEARARGLAVVADTGALVWDLFHTEAVYAATAVRRGAARPQGLRGPPWPAATRGDAEATARATGLPLGEAERYHMEAVRLDFNRPALLSALGLLREALEALWLLWPGTIKPAVAEAGWGAAEL